MNEKEKALHLGRDLAVFTKTYIGVLSKKLEDLGIERYFYVLLTVSQAKTKCTQQHIANTLKIDKVTMVKIVDYLSGKGYVEREQNAEDRREYFLQLTAKGKKTVPLIQRAIEEINKAAVSGLTVKQQKEFYSMLEKINSNLALLPSSRMIIKMQKA